MNGNPISGERVVIVEVHSGHVRLKTGHITDPSPAGAQKRKETVVWGDRQFRPGESANDAFEKAFQVDDIHLLKEEEARLLQNPGAAQSWFGSIYQDRLVAKIHRALKRLTSPGRKSRAGSRRPAQRCKPERRGSLGFSRACLNAG